MQIIVFRSPVITGRTALNEGDSLYLDCDASNSIPHASVEWVGPERVKVSNGWILEIMNIQRSAAGIYTCVATYPISGATMNSTVNITVQCEYHDIYKDSKMSRPKEIEGMRKNRLLYRIEPRIHD